MGGEIRSLAIRFLLLDLHNISLLFKISLIKTIMINQVIKMLVPNYEPHEDITIRRNNQFHCSAS